MLKAAREETKESSVESVPTFSDTTGMLLRLTVLAREIIVTENVALSRGSSQQGKALRAYVGYVETLRKTRNGGGIGGVTSNWVRE